MLWTLRLREVEAAEPGWRADMERQVRRGLDALPGLASALDTDEVVAANVRHQLCRSVDWIYLTACKTVPGLLDEVVSYEGCDLLAEALAKGPVILAAFHFGPSEILVSGIARRVAPVTVVVSDPKRRPAAHDLRGVMRAATAADVQTVASGSIGVLLACLRALRDRRLVMIFPELSLDGVPEDGTVIMFGDRAIYARQGIATLAAKTGATVVPCHVERPGQRGFFRCVIGAPFQPGPNLTADIFTYCEALIRGGLAADWDFWPEVRQHLLKMPSGWPRLAALSVLETPS